VETAVAAKTLMQYGCHRAQGFLLSRPVVAEDMASLLSTRTLTSNFLADYEFLSANPV
jgi:EAL domain-containing protein (putative c-di-GMP-specific phosphodiesterase class I)